MVVARSQVLDGGTSLVDSFARPLALLFPLFDSPSLLRLALSLSLSLCLNDSLSLSLFLSVSLSLSLSFRRQEAPFYHYHDDC